MANDGGAGNDDGPQQEEMTTEKFTPGPWTVSEYTNYAGWSVFGGKLECLAERWPGYTPSDQERAEAHANARLIAAAPDMYAALTALIGLIEENKLVRDISRDSEPGWALECLAIVRGVRMATDALAKAVQP